MGKERGESNKKPEGLGVSTGAPEGRKIEFAREKWAAERRATYPEALADLAVIKREDEEFLEYPILGAMGLEAYESWVPRVEPITGYVYTTRWQRINLDPEKAKSYGIIGGKRHSEDVELEDTPRSWKVIVLVPQKIEEGLEAAMRQQDEVRHSYGARRGVEQLRVGETLLHIFQLSEKFASGQVKSQKDLELLARRAEKMLKQEGIIESDDHIWQEIADFVVRAVKKDSLGRINPQRSRILARAAYLRAIEKEVDVRLVREKANRVFHYLETARAITRFQLESAKQEIVKVAGFGDQKGISPFREDGEMDPRVALKISEILRGIIEVNLRPILAAPYMHTARGVEAILMGDHFKSRKEIAVFEKELEVAGFLGELKKSPVEYYLRHKETFLAKIRLRHAYSLIEETLEDPDNKHTRVFNETS